LCMCVCLYSWMHDMTILQIQFTKTIFFFLFPFFKKTEETKKNKKTKKRYTNDNVESCIKYF